MSKEKVINRNHIICIDFETGGLNARKNPITQVALQSFRLDTLEEISRYSTYVKGYCDLVHEDAAMKFTGIKMSDLQSGGLTIEEVVNDLCEEFKKANLANSHTKKPALLGHNILFDISFLQYAFDKCKVDLSKYIDCKEDAFGNQIPQFFDTMLLSRMKWSNDLSMTSFALSKCCEKAGIDLFDAHDAFNDVIATKNLFLYLLNNVRTGTSTSIEAKEARFRNTFEF